MSLFNKFKNNNPAKAGNGNKPATKEPKPELSLAEMKEQQQKAEPKKAHAAKNVKEDTKNAYRILINPLITEKGTYLASENKYLFSVAPSANKVEIAKAIFALYGVKPIKINIIRVSGKDVRYGKTTGRTKDTKKAIVTLKKGDTMEVYEGV